MPFQLEKTKVDLRDTPIENLFLDLYMPTAPGDYVKVYLLGFRYALESAENKRFTTNTLAINLGLSPGQILDAWDYWHNKGLIRMSASSSQEDPVIEFLSLKTLHLKNTPSATLLAVAAEGEPPVYTASPSDLENALDEEAFRHFFKSVDRLLQRPLVPNESLQILEWIHHYKMSREVIFLAFQYAVHQKEVRSVPYVAGIVRNWADQGLTTTEAVQSYLDSYQLRYRHYDTIFKTLGFHGRLPSEAESQLMDQWLDQYGFSLDMITKACGLTAGTSKPSIKYVNGILERWYGEGLTTPEAVDRHEAQRKENAAANKEKHKETHKEKNSTATNPVKKTGFHLPESRGKDYTNEDLEKILLGRKRRQHKEDPS